MSEPLDLDALRAAVGAIKHGAVLDGGYPTGITKDEALDYAADLADGMDALLDRLEAAERECDAWCDRADRLRDALEVAAYRMGQALFTEGREARRHLLVAMRTARAVLAGEENT